MTPLANHGIPESRWRNGALAEQKPVSAKQGARKVKETEHSQK
jgi:hypothetical protein